MTTNWQEYTPSWPQVWAFSRHVGTYLAGQVGGVATAITVLHIATPEQAQVLADSVNGMISSGTSFIEYTSGLVGVSIAIYSGWKKTTKNMIAAAAAAAAAADSTLPKVTKGIVVSAAAPPAMPTALGKEAVQIKGTIQ